MLTGKHDRKAPPPAGTRFALGTAASRYQEHYWNEKEFETIEALGPIAAEVGNSMTTIVLSWVLANPAITAPIVEAPAAPNNSPQVLPPRKNRYRSI